MENGLFFRVEKFAISAPFRKTGANNVDKIAGEAARVEGYCPQVALPQYPVIWYGADPVAVAQLAKDWAALKSGLVIHKPSGRQIKRKYRSDQPCLAAGVISVPPSWKGEKKWPDFVHSSIQFLVSKFGIDRLVSVIEHVDEPAPHLHFYLVPLPNEEFFAVHPGEAAIQKVGGRKAPRVIRDQAYKAAMASLLDDFYVDVARAFGFERTTVKRKRLSRNDWLKSKSSRQEPVRRRRQEDHVPSISEEIQVQEPSVADRASASSVAARLKEYVARLESGESMRPRMR